MSGLEGGPVLLIGLDAAEVTLIDRGMADGSLPNLARLRKQGCHGTLDSPANWLVGAPWPSFYTSSWPSDHGFVNYLQWRSEFMTHSRPEGSWLPLRPFWRERYPSGLRAIAIDVPVTYPPSSGPSLELCGWSSHDKLWAPAANPPELLTSVHREFGTSPMDPEVAGLQRVSALLRQRDRLCAAAARTSEVALAFMERHPWDLFLVVFGSTHRGGHQFWDRTGLRDVPTSSQEELFDTALSAIYRACDEAIGRLLSRVPDNTRILVFALHGMGPNHSRNPILPAMLERILRGEAGHDEARRPGPGALSALRKRIPLQWRTAVKSRLPRKVQDRLALFWHREHKVDWSRTRAFTYLADLEGYVQANLQDREREGILSRAESAALLEEIGEGLKTFTDEDTGAPIVDRVGRSDQVYPPGSMLHLLPDLIVRWKETPASAHRAVTSPRFGRIPWPTPGRNPDGRSGHHRSTGWLIASGPGMAEGSVISQASVLDLAPTALAWLGEPVPSSMRGHPIPDLVARGSPT